MLATIRAKKAESVKATGQRRASVSIGADGNIIVTDLWKDLQLGSSSKPKALQLQEVSADFSTPYPIGIVDFGMLLGEEPPVNGMNGTGALYVHGCGFRCSTCYQPEFFSKKAKVYTSVRALAEMMLQMEAQGASTISLIVASYQHPLHDAIQSAKLQGLKIPVVYKYAGVLSSSQIEKLSRDVDIFLPDLKGLSADLLALHGLDSSYGEQAKKSLQHVLTTTSKTVIVRHLLVPHYSNASDEIKKILTSFDWSRENTYLSILTHFMDPLTKRVHSASKELISDIQCFAALANCTLFIQGQAGYDY